MRNEYLYEIGGIICEMSPAHAENWNAGNLCAASLRGADVCMSAGGRCTLWKFITRDSPEVYEKQMHGMPANRVR